jgi:phage host-nuclease inhibitor protein Gam
MLKESIRIELIQEEIKSVKRLIDKYSNSNSDDRYEQGLDKGTLMTYKAELAFLETLI